MPRARDHLRIRGEHRWLAIALPSSLGIIPAYAGNTASATMGVDLEAGSSPHTRGTLRWTGPRKPNSGDHPRIRGEHVRHVVRGARARGIIPAYAGNTYTCSGRCFIIALDHPRIRGEHSNWTVDSPGLTWIIPAYAGNTPLSDLKWRMSAGSSPHTRGTRPRAVSRSTCPRDHPRIRGEHDGAGHAALAVEGIIPAYAGNTRGLARFDTLHPGSSPHTRGTRRKEWCRNEHPRDHPRIRGEHEIPQIDAAFAWGIIPAYAGNTWFSSLCVNLTPGSSPHTRGTRSWRRSSSRLRRDHPRIRGEHDARAKRHVVVSGIIPAYAGNTRYAAASRWS